MKSSVGQLCLNVVDLATSLRFYETLGLTISNRTESPHRREAIVAHAEGHGGSLQLIERTDNTSPIDHGNAVWKLYINTNDIAGMYQAAIDAGYESMMAPERTERWPVTVAFIHDPDGYVVELVERHPWPDPSMSTWVGQYCIYVGDIEDSISFWETAGLTLTSRTEIPDAHEAILESAGGDGGKIQLAQRTDDDSPIDRGSALPKLHLRTEDGTAVHATMLDAGYREQSPPTLDGGSNATISVVLDRDGYEVAIEGPAPTS